MGEIGIAGKALLVPVRPHGIDVGAIEQRLIGTRVVLLDPFHQRVLAHHATPRAPALRQASILTPLLGRSPPQSSVRTPKRPGTQAQRPPRPEPPPEEPPPLAEGSV